MKAKLSAIPSKTMADKKYCVNVWKQWCAHISTERRSYLGSYTPERNIYPSKKTKRRGISSKFTSANPSVISIALRVLLTPNNSTGYPCYSLIVDQIFKKSFATVATLYTVQSLSPYFRISIAGTFISSYDSS